MASPPFFVHVQISWTLSAESVKMSSYVEESWLVRHWKLTVGCSWRGSPYAQVQLVNVWCVSSSSSVTAFFRLNPTQNRGYNFLYSFLLILSTNGSAYLESSCSWVIEKVVYEQQQARGQSLLLVTKLLLCFTCYLGTSNKRITKLSVPFRINSSVTVSHHSGPESI